MTGTSGRRAHRANAQRLLDSPALDYLDRSDVSRASMFGSAGLQVNGKFFAFVGVEAHLVTKLPAAQAATLVTKDQAARVRAGRNPTREWISTSQDEQVACFRNVAGHLEPGGCFVIEVGVPDLRRLPPGEAVRPFTATPDRLGFDEYDVAAQGLVSTTTGSPTIGSTSCRSRSATCGRPSWT